MIVVDFQSFWYYYIILCEFNLHSREKVIILKTSFNNLE